MDTSSLSRPLDVSRLSDAVRTVAGEGTPAPLKMMAARGLSPLGPRDLVTALYQLSTDADEAIADAARKTSSKLPDKILIGPLAEALPGPVLDFFARMVAAARRHDLLEPVLLNPALHDATVAFLASKEAHLDDVHLEIIAQNERRLLRAPEVVAALYLNPRARMSSVDRAVELCVRNGVRVEGIANFDEIVEALSANKAGAAAAQAAADDAAFEKDLQDAAFREFLQGEDAADLNDDQLEELHAILEAAAEQRAELAAKKKENEEEPKKKELPIEQRPLNEKLRLAQIGNAGQKLVLVRDPNKLVAMSVIKSPALTDKEVGFVVRSRQVCGEVIRYAANHREWQKSYQVRCGLASNPKTPFAVALRILPYLRAHDLKGLSRSKSVPAAVANAARELINKRS